jgi:hypothetical protein
VIDPGEKALNNPLPGLNGEAKLHWICTDDPNCDFGGVGNALSGIAIISEQADQAVTRLTMSIIRFHMSGASVKT